MKYIITYEKYTHTPQDKIDDMELIREFSKKFEDLFEFRLNLNKFSGPEFRGYLGYGASVHYFGHVELDNPEILKRKVDIKFNIFLDTDINPNGISGEDDIARTFSIKFEIRKNKSRNINRIKGFYGYSRDMEGVLEEFDNYLIDKLGIGYLSEEERERLRKQKEFNKKIRQFNL